MRSMLFVPADSERKLARGLESGADALILDLEDSVAASNRPTARKLAREFLEAHGPDRILRYVRINPLATGFALDDLAATVAGRPDGILLPKCLPEDVRTLDQILGAPGEPFQREQDRPHSLARSLCLLAAAAAEVVAIDTIYTDFKDPEGLRTECLAARRSGFAAKMAIHPAQLATINEAFSVSAAEREWAERVIAAFAANPDAGTLALDGKMIDKPHRTLARRLLGLSPT